MTRSAFEQVRALLGEILRDGTDRTLVLEAAALQARLDGPLRVAVAGRAKAGKSTLVNALVGERVAPTDAGECTKLVTWYRQGLAYEVNALLRDGRIRSVPFERSDDGMQYAAALADGHEGLQEIERLDVSWPSSALADVTIIDTPGLSSIDESSSRRGMELLAPADERASDADAVIYLMSHVHRRDVEFLSAFLDRDIAHASPANTVAVLSRADEIGAGRLDALDSAARIAARYRAHPELRGLCGEVLPIAGLLAETAATLREHEVQDLLELSRHDDQDLEELLRSVDRFVAADRSSLGAERRHHLLARFGIFGVRLALRLIRTGEVRTSVALALQLREHSGIGALRDQIASAFLPRARVLQVRAALSTLRAAARSLELRDASIASRLADRVEEIECSTIELAGMRALHLAVTGLARLREGERDELRRVVLGGNPATTVGLEGAAPVSVVLAAAMRGVDHWRTRAADPVLDPATGEVCDTMARSYESVWAGVRTQPAIP